jgi:putative Holliday junction resolvase
MRHLAIDLGAKRIGLALSDQGGRFATPHEVVTVSDPAQAVEPILKLIVQEGVERLVVGLPLNMDGSMGPEARAAVAWGQALEKRSGITVVFVDERLSSFHAEQQLNARKRGGEKLTRKRRKAQLDAVAAAGFLQEYLDGRLPAVPVG